MSRFIFDIETNGLLPEVSKIHCAVLLDIDTGEVKGFRPDEIPSFLTAYQNADLLVGHNCIKFDCPVIEKLHGIGVDRSKVHDTMVLGRLVHSDIKSTDFERARRWKDYFKATEAGDQWLDPIPREFPGNLVGAHSLKAWGCRLGVHKGDYAGGWEHFNEEMYAYMLQDGEVTLALYRALMKHEPSEQSVELEHRIAWLCAKIERNGFPFDVKAASEFYGRLSDEREALRRDLVGLFPNWKERLPDFIPKRDNKTKGYIAGVPVECWRELEFNPTSRDHIADRLSDKYGWKPTDFTDGGKPTVDDEVLAKLPYPEAQKLARYFLLDKRIGQLAEGNQAWLKVERNGKVHCSYNTNGAVTGRATHSHPNISQVPRVSSPFGRDCRALFGVPDGWVQLGSDQQGLELRCLASDLALAGDEGRYATVVTEGDVHTSNQQAAGLSTRDNAKTFIYAFLYGAGDEKIGSIVGKGRNAGKALKSDFQNKTPGLASLIKTVKDAAGRGWIKGIDGRKMPIRSSNAALNTRLQNSGAIICKQWGCDWDDGLQAAGLRHGWDGDYVFMLWSHDEYQLAVRNDPELIALVSKIGKETGRNAGLPYNFKCPLDVDIKIGTDWSTTH